MQRGISIRDTLSGMFSRGDGDDSQRERFSHNPVRRNTGTRSTITQYSGGGYRTSSGPGGGRATAAGLHGERLHQIVVFELREDGSTEYSTMALRALYNYVVTTITEACREANENRRDQLTRQGRQRQRQLHLNRGGVVNHSIGSLGAMGSDYSHGVRGSIDIGGSLTSNLDMDGSYNSVGMNNIGAIQEEDEDEEGVYENGSGNGIPNDRSPDPMTPSDVVPPHLPSLTSSHNSTPPNSDGSATPTNATLRGNNHTPHLPSLASSVNTSPPSSNDATPNRSNHTQHHGHVHFREQTEVLHQQRLAQTAFTPLLNNGNTPRERLGGYLHPRDMRRLVTPFSSSNEPQLMVRRHVMLLNFDPLRAIVLRDRLLVLVPDGADSILIELERRVRGGITEIENQVFGNDPATKPPPTAIATPIKKKKTTMKRNKSSDEVNKVRIVDDNGGSIEGSMPSDHATSTATDTSSNTDESAEDTHHSIDEWEDIQNMDWKNMPYELQSVDAVLQTVTAMLMDDARKVHQRSSTAMSDLRGETPGSKSGLGDNSQERLRLHKDEVNQMEGRVQGFVRAMNEVLDDDEDMTLMNLSRLLTHPERFLQPVSKEIMHEESDEPELILEAYLQEALGIVNEMDSLKKQIVTTEEQISMTLDAIRNKLLYINTLLSVASLAVSVGSFIGSIFGMNLTNGLETQERTWMQVTVYTIVGMVLMWAALSWIFYRAANIQKSDLGKKDL